MIAKESSFLTFKRMLLFLGLWLMVALTDTVTASNEQGSPSPVAKSNRKRTYSIAVEDERAARFRLHARKPVFVSTTSRCNSTSLSVTSDDEDLLEKTKILRAIVRTIKNEYPLTIAMFHCLPSALQLSIVSHHPILHINGDELEPVKWEHQLCFLEFITIPNYLEEVHIQNLPFTLRIVSLIYRVLQRNSLRLKSLIIRGCFMQEGCQLDWNLSSFPELTTFELSKTTVDQISLCYVINNLPIGITSLNVSQNVLPIGQQFYVPISISHLNVLEELCLGGFDLSESHTLSLVKHVCNVPSLKIIRLCATSLGQAVLHALPNYSPNWIHVSLKKCYIHESSVLTNSDIFKLPCLESLDLSGNYFFAQAAIDIIRYNPRLKYVNLEGLYDDINEIPISSQTKINFREMQLVESNWKAILSIFTKVLLDCFTSAFLDRKVLSAAKKDFSFAHITDLHVVEIVTGENFDLMADFLDCMPNLKSLVIGLDTTREKCWESKLFGMQFESIETLEIRILNQGNQNDFSTERLVAQLMKIFCGMQRLHIFTTEPININGNEMIMALQSLQTTFPNLQEINYDTKLDFCHAVSIFNWLATLSKLETVQIHFDRYSEQYQPKVEELNELRLKHLTISFGRRLDIEHELSVLFSKLKCLLRLKASKVNDGAFKAIVKNLSTFRRLRYLKMVGTIPDNYFSTFLQELKHLSLLTTLKTQLIGISCEENEQFRDLEDSLPFLRERQNARTFFLQRIQILVEA